jgi:hypothetical protein
VLGADKSFHRDDLNIHDWAGFHEWQIGLSENDKDYLFAMAGSLFIRHCGRKSIPERATGMVQSLWHRDLLDSRVVEELLTDPWFYMTVMKDDEVIK